jgi:hypothetical protein
MESPEPFTSYREEEGSWGKGVSGQDSGYVSIDLTSPLPPPEGSSLVG